MLAPWIHKDFRFDGRRFVNSQDLRSFIKRDYPDGVDLIDAWLSNQGRVEVTTSGSTGIPKKIHLTRDAMIESAEATGRFFDLEPRTTALLCLPLKYIAGKMMLVRAMTLGWRLKGIKPGIDLMFDIEDSFNFSAMTPVQVARNLNQLEAIQTIIVGGGAVNTILKSKLRDHPTQFFASYGMTETITHIALKPLNKAAGRDFEQDVYTALPEVYFAQDPRDCLVIQCPRISKQDIVTNDVVQLLNDRQFVWKGRYDNIVNSGGIKLFPEELEQKFTKALTTRFFATGIEDEELGQKLVFVIESDKIETEDGIEKKGGEGKDSLIVQLQNFQAQHPEQIARYEVPKEVLFVPKFIETETRKIDRLKTLSALGL